MAEYTISITAASISPMQDISASIGKVYEFSIPFTATIPPDINFDTAYTESPLTINVTGGLLWSGRNGSRTLTINSITLKSTDTTYATYDTPYQVSGESGSGDSKDVQLIVSDPNTLFSDLSTKSISIVMNVTNNGGSDTWSPILRIYDQDITYISNNPTFPLNVEIGSPKYTTVSQINYSAGTDSSVQVTPESPDTTPVSNSYYTFQSQDGQYWMTAYVGNWTNNDGVWTADITWSSSNTDTLPAQSICWCVWTKEYYDSITDKVVQNTSSITSLNGDLTTLTSDVSQNTTDISTLTPKVNNSFVNATKIGDSTLRLTRNNGTTVDISFPKGVNVRSVDISTNKNITASSNELVIITGNLRASSKTTRFTITITGYGYLTAQGKLFTGDNYIGVFAAGKTGGFTNMSASDPISCSGLLYNGGRLSYTRS